MVPEPLILGAQGSFFFGGSVSQRDGGVTLHSDAAYVKFQAPPDPAWPPIVMWHGGGQHSKTFETTPDGREGYLQIWVRRGHPVYIIDQAGRGGASQTSATAVGPKTELYDHQVFGMFRLGHWEPPNEPVFFPNLAFPRDRESLDQFFFQILGLFGHDAFTEETQDFHAANMGRLLDRIGPSILITHSHSGGYGWISALHRPDLVRAIVSYEPNVYPFPSDEVPLDIPCDNAMVAQLSPIRLIAPETFESLIRTPIQIVFGDNIQRAAPDGGMASQFWHRSSRRAQQFVEAANRRGGKAEVLHLPDHGVRGNTHFPFTDLNNIEVADMLSEFLGRHGLGAPP